MIGPRKIRMHCFSSSSYSTFIYLMKPDLSPLSPQSPNGTRRPISRWLKRRITPSIVIMLVVLTCSFPFLLTVSRLITTSLQYKLFYADGLISYTFRSLPPSRNDALVPPDLITKNDSKPEPFFTSTSVTNFRNELKQLRGPLNTSKTLVFTDNGNTQGFGSFVNMLLMAFEYAQEPTIQRQFHILTKNWVYGSWSDYFSDDHLRVDLPDGTTIPFILDSHDDVPEVTYQGLKTTLNLYKTHDGRARYDVKETNKVPIQHFGCFYPGDAFYRQIYTGMQLKLAHHLSLDERIMRRRPMAQAIWDLKPHLRERFDEMRRDVVGAGKYVACHVRRGDKITAKEMPELQLSVYVDGILKHAGSNDPSIDTLVIMSDDQKAAENVKNAIEQKQGHNFTNIILWDDAYNRKYINDSKDANEGGWIQKEFSKLDQETRKAQTEALILGITMLAKSDYLVCTFSSNLCRLVQVLREQDLDSVHSLDWAWFNL